MQTFGSRFNGIQVGTQLVTRHLPFRGLLYRQDFLGGNSAVIVQPLPDERGRHSDTTSKFGLGDAGGFQILGQVHDALFSTANIAWQAALNDRTLATLQNPPMKKPAPWKGSSLLTADGRADVERLAALVKAGAPGIQARVADDLGVTPAYISQIVKGHRPLNLRFAAAFARQLGVQIRDISPTWAEEAEKLASPNIAPATKSRWTVPLISFVQAGGWVEATDTYAVGDGAQFLDVDLEVSDRTFALEIVGDSMSPEFQPGDLIIVDPAITPGPGDCVVAKNGEHEATFKKYRPRGVNESGAEVFELVPQNDDYPTLYSDRQPITIIGVMVEHRRRRRR